MVELWLSTAVLKRRVLRICILLLPIEGAKMLRNITNGPAAIPRISDLNAKYSDLNDQNRVLGGSADRRYRSRRRVQLQMSRASHTMFSFALS